MFDAFEKPSYLDWKAQVTKELKGKDFDTFLQWNFENWRFNAYFDASTQSKEAQKLDAQISQLHTARSSEAAWKGAQKIWVSDENKANEEALMHLKTGVDTLQFVFKNEAVNLDRLFQNIQVEIIHVRILLPFPISSEQIAAYKSWNHASHVLFELAPVNAICKHPDTFPEPEHIHVPKEEIDGYVVDAAEIANAGGTIEQQLEYAIRAGLHILRATSAIRKPIRFHFGISPAFFPEIAKLRSFTWLWHVLAQQISPNPWGIDLLSSEGSTLFLAIRDEQNNTLRSTTSCAAAILGGSGEHRVIPHDFAYQTPTFFSARIANNIHHILREESFLHQNVDPAFGAYYLSEMCVQMVQTILKKDLETDVCSDLLDRSFQTRIKASYDALQEQIDAGDIAWLGVNLYPNDTDPNQEKTKRVWEDLGILSPTLGVNAN